MKNSQLLYLNLITVFSIGQAVGQTIVYDNNAGGASGIDQSFGSDLDSGFLQADDVTLTSDTVITGVQWTGVYLGSQQTAPAADHFTVSIFANAAGSPDGGAMLASFNVGNAVSRQDSGIDLFAVTNIYNYEAAINYTFAAGTTYWVAISTDTSDDAEDNFFWTSQLNQGNHHFSQDNGATWAAGSNPNGSRHDFRLSGVPIPEPSSMMFLGLSALAIFKRRR